MFFKNGGATVCILKKDRTTNVFLRTSKMFNVCLGEINSVTESEVEVTTDAAESRFESDRGGGNESSEGIPR